MSNLIKAILDEVWDEEMANLDTMSNVEMISVNALIAYKAEKYHIDTINIECALFAEFRNWPSNGTKFSDVMRWLVNYGFH